jgi:hypothetical protein
MQDPGLATKWLTRERASYHRWDKTITPEHRKDHALKSTYGLDFGWPEYQKLLTQHEYKCAICHIPHTEKAKLVVDHCHKTGKIRGLLCRKCNSGIGFFDERPDIFWSARRYLDAYTGDVNYTI